MNAPNMDAAQIIQTNEQHQIVVELVVSRETINTSTTHQVTPQTYQPTIGNEYSQWWKS